MSVSPVQSKFSHQPNCLWVYNFRWGIIHIISTPRFDWSIFYAYKFIQFSLCPPSRAMSLFGHIYYFVFCMKDNKSLQVFQNCHVIKQKSTIIIRSSTFLSGLLEIFSRTPSSYRLLQIVLLPPRFHWDNWNTDTHCEENSDVIIIFVTITR